MTTNDDLKVLLLNIQSDLNKKMDIMERDIKVLRTENAKFSKDFSSHNTQCRELKVKNKILERKVDSCEAKIDYLLNREKCKNLILFKR